MELRLLALLSLLSMTAAAEQWEIVTSVIVNPPPAGVAVSIVGPLQQPFARPLPRTLDPHLLSDFHDELNVLQDLELSGNNTFTLTSEQARPSRQASYVAAIPDGYVQGEGGLVFDGQRRVYNLPYFHYNRTSATPPLPAGSAPPAACEHYSSLATVVQRFGHMYYHFLAEALPRVVLLQRSGLLTPDYLAKLGILPSQLVAYDPSHTYCAGTLLVPTPTPRITPPREALEATREALGIGVLLPEQRQLLVYSSREGQDSRRVSNEAQLLSAVAAAFPAQRLVVHYGNESIDDTIALFQQAKVVFGPHGAGLTHALFSAPGTTLLELTFLADPPLIYWLIGVPQAYYMVPAMEAPVEEVLDVLALAIGPAPPPDACPAGSSAPPSGHSCVACGAGTYAAVPGSKACKSCVPGRAASQLGTIGCRTAQPGAYAPPGGAAFLPCPQGTFSALPGAWAADQCLAPTARRRALEEQALSPALLAKLSPLFARALRERRVLAQSAAPGASLAAGSAQAPLTAHELCLTQQLAGAVQGYGGGPYRLPAVNCPLPAAAPAPAPSAATMYTGEVPLVTAMDGPPDSSYPSNPSGLQLPPVALPVLSTPVTSGGKVVAQLPQQPHDPPSIQVQTGGNQSQGLPEPQGPLPPTPPKKVLDTFVIAVLGVLAALVLLPLLACLVGRVLSRRQLARARAARPLLLGEGGSSSASPLYHDSASSGVSPSRTSPLIGARVAESGAEHAIRESII